jgi:hypothetical protein
MSRSSIRCRFFLFNGALTLMIMLSVVAGVAVSARPSSMMLQCRFEPDGYFYIKGGSPQGFEEVDHIQLVTDKGVQLPPGESRLYVESGRAYRFTQLGEFRTHSSGGGLTFEFKTETIEGVSYEFSGKFDSICILAESEHDPTKVVALGRLMKFTNGAKTAAAEVDLTYSKSERRQESRSPNDSAAAAGRGSEVLAILRKIEPKAYTDDLPNGEVLASDVFHFEVVDPKELRKVTVVAYYRGVPDLGGRRLKNGDLVYFELPSVPQRAGIFLWDLKGLRFRD